MAMTTEEFLIGRGTTIAYTLDPTATTPTYVTLAEVTELDGLEISLDDIEGGKLASTFVPSRPGIPKGERSNLTLQFKPGDTGLSTISGWIALGKPPTVGWKITWEDTSTTTFKGYVGGIKLKGITNNDRLLYDVPLKVTSYPVHTVAA